MNVEISNFNDDALQQQLEAQRRQQETQRQQEEVQREAQLQNQQTNNVQRQSQELKDISQETNREKNPFIREPNFGNTLLPGAQRLASLNPEQREALKSVANDLLSTNKTNNAQSENQLAKGPYWTTGVNDFLSKALPASDELKANALNVLKNTLTQNNKSIDEQKSEFTKALTSSGLKPEEAKAAASLLASLPAQTDSEKNNFSRTATSLVNLDAKDAGKEAEFIGIAKDAMKDLKPSEQQKLFSDLLSSNPNLKDNDKQRDAFAAVLAHLPDGKSAGNLTNKLLTTLSDQNLNDSDKQSKTLALVSNHLAEARQGDLSQETRDLHRDLVANLISTNGVDPKTANAAAKILDNVDPDKKENVIKLALAVTKEQDPLKTLTGDLKTLADKSGLTPAQAQEARKNITEAGIKILQETAKEQGINLDKGKIISLLSKGPNSLVGEDGKIDQSDLSRLAAQFVRDGAPGVAYAKADQVMNSLPLGGLIFGGMVRAGLSQALGDIAAWQPGYTNGSEAQNSMNGNYYGAVNQLQSQIGSKAPELNTLASLIQAGGIKSENPISRVNQNDLYALQSLNQVNQALSDGSNPFRVEQGKVSEDANGKFELFTDKSQGTEFYKLTQPNGDERYAIKTGQDDWKFLNRNDLSYNGKSYADSVNSFRESKALALQAQSQIASKSDSSFDPKYDRYTTQDGKTIAVFKSNDPQQQNIVYAKGEGETFKQVSPEQASAYRAAVANWNSKVQTGTEPTYSDGNKYKIYTANDGTRIAIGNAPENKGAIFTQSPGTDRAKWTPYQAQVNQQRSQQNYQSTFQPTYQQSFQPSYQPSFSPNYQQSRSNSLNQFDGSRKARGIYTN